MLRSLVALFGLVACGAEGEPRNASRSQPPILVLAVDGFEWSVILPLLRAGRMPHFASLVERGTWGKLEPLTPTISPRLWTTIATGHLPEEHGIKGFFKRDDDGREFVYTSRDRQVKAFWNILTDAGITTDTIGWWNTFPAEEVNGLMVAQTNVSEGDLGLRKGKLHEGLPGQVWPLSSEATVFATLAENDARIDDLKREIFGDVLAEIPPAKQQRWLQCDWAFRADSTYVALLLQRLEQGPPAEVTAIYLGGTDVVGHRFWAAYRPDEFGLEPDGQEATTYGHMIESYYEYTDAVFGRILARFPRETTVLVVSDHGMSALRKLVRKGITEEDCEEFTGGHLRGDAGAFLACGARVAARAPVVPIAEIELPDIPVLGKVFDFCPTLLALLGLPYGEDMIGRPLEELFDPAFLVEHPLHSIPTHDDPEWFGARRGEFVQPRSEERWEQLKQLGYFGDEEDE